MIRSGTRDPARLAYSQQPADRGGVVRPKEGRDALGAAVENVVDHTFKDESRNGLDVAVGDDISL